VLRPYASPLPLGFFSFAVGMALMSGIGLGWLSSGQDVHAAGVLMAAFVFPLELLATVIALLTRDTAAATALGLFTTSWLGLGLLDVVNPTTGVAALVVLALACFAGTAFLLEDLRGSTRLVLRRGQAADAISSDTTEQRPAEPGVRDQL
jgi:hypothetical protein